MKAVGETGSLVRGASVRIVGPVAGVLAAWSLVSCSGAGADALPGKPSVVSAPAAPSGSSVPSPTAAPGEDGGPADPAVSPGEAAPEEEDAPPGIAAEAVRDAFAGVQATLGDSCTPGNCAYFLDRVAGELGRLERAMRADRQGPGHFKEPLAWTAELWQELGADRSFGNLRKHQQVLIGTRDRINSWMQGHPEDYR